MKKLMMCIVAMYIFSSSFCYAVAYYFPVIKRMQPDGTVFRVCEWGDEFQMNMETKEGYSCDYHLETGYFHYTVRGEEGLLKLVY